MDSSRTAPAPSPTPSPTGEELAPSSPSHVGKGNRGSGAVQTQRSAQVALAVFFAVLLGLLAVRGYGSRLGARPTELLPVANTDLNTADQAELGQIPGVGPKLAAAIADHRTANGPFRSVEDLRAVKGVGPKTLEKVRVHVRAQAPEGDGAEAGPPVLERWKPKPASAGARKLQPGDPPIDVNTASLEDLQRLPGVGAITARNIAAARPFRTAADLDRVKGIGPKTMDKIRPFIVVK